MVACLITGWNGFLGSTICSNLDFNFTTLGRNQSSNIVCDLSKEIPRIDKSFDLVIHAAGKAHSVPRTDEEKKVFFDVNEGGTANLLSGLNNNVNKPKTFVFISSVAVYGLQSASLVKEDSPLDAKDPYGLSKINAENIVRAWCEDNGVACVILRLPLLVGERPLGNLGSMIKGIKNGFYFNIAGGNSRKSMVLSDDVVKIIPSVLEHNGTYNLTDGYHPSFLELSHLIADQLKRQYPLNIPSWMAFLISKIGDFIGPKAPINSNKLAKITSDLTFDDSLARKELSWSPTPVLKGFRLDK